MVTRVSDFLRVFFFIIIIIIIIITKQAHFDKRFEYKTYDRKILEK
jgi:preprotein translocase subunit SecG